ncbi:MAG: Crp/Fnr family transcriptional regulator [Candidatus Thiodiazotropha sp. (ex Ctena orbiculata)]|uniref:Crp/Fnr family transcriptional regulator n=1 Tax=Candidatus Thiodiazotropha taylori TaxID=2792791 RepID=A0A944MEB1_9GAMM|nr:Crp/Fnr family transcriptional regulator [Candidatus Thiodiazotropha taylori]PUB86893.1 MAG: Crp/Fnr family transcriptional regulator [gamma proteobacterium symbiont of Ctena orbiculata]MBT2989862.1 Crp/Fnr family transcriptional regulator [Candidatus Thiodiazotropha taylori]MBT2995424.1 Crp/Fnr family transcriptional regulator [Candidatus Thiodiazotropha taylori]MBT3001572.1 Crp/Fnr family transcriptional regulator [Candidatus Thiodiazotropha taylori]
MSIDLKQCYLFAHLDEGQFEKVKGMAHEIRLRDGQLFFQSGDPATHFYLVIQGQIKLTRLSMQGQEKVIEIISPGQTFAEALMFGESPEYPVNAVAIGDSYLLSFENTTFLEILRGSIDTCFRLMGDMSHRLKSLIREIDELTLQSASCRVASFLWKRWEARPQGDKSFKLEVPKGVIASRLSVTPETFSRILHNFSSQGLIHVDGGRVDVLDERGLLDFADISGRINRDISSN